MSPSLLQMQETASVQWLHDARSDHALVSYAINQSCRIHHRPRIVPWQNVRSEDQERHAINLQQLAAGDIHEWEAQVLASAKTLRPQSSRRTVWHDALDEARDQIRRATTAQEWSTFRRALWRMQRRIQRHHALLNARKARTIRKACTRVEYFEVEEPEGQYVRSADIQIWQSFLRDHAFRTYGEGVQFQEQACWLALVAHTSRAQQRLAQTTGVGITERHVEAALRRCKHDKAAGPNGLQYGHILTASEAVVPTLARMFSARAANPTFQEGSPWQQITLQLIPKGSRRTLASTRPIALLDVLQRIYLRSLLEAMRTENIVSRAEWQYGGFAGYQVADMVFALQAALLRASEWGVGIVIVKLDIRDAFSCVSYDTLMQALFHAQIPAPFVAALLQEIFGCTTTVRMGSVETMETIQMQRGLRQGGPESTLIWNCFLRFVLDDLWKKWQHEGRGFGLEKGAVELGNPTATPHCTGRDIIPLMAWVDDLTLLANSMQEAQMMLDELLACLHKHGLRIKANKAQFISGYGAVGALHVHDTVVDASDSMVVLGISLRSDGTSKSHLEDTICRAAITYRTHRATLFSRHVSLREKLRHWQITVAATTLWGWEVFPILHNALRRLDSMQLRHIAWITGFRAKGVSDLPQRWQQAMRHARCIMLEHGIPHLSMQILRRYHSWAGHMSRGDSIGHKLLQWRNEHWRVTHMHQVPWSARQLRTRAGRPILWERQLLDTVGRGWCELASNRDTWKAARDDWVAAVMKRRRLGFAATQGLHVDS